MPSLRGGPLYRAREEDLCAEPGHGSSEGHDMLKRNDKCHSIVVDVPISKM